MKDNTNVYGIRLILESYSKQVLDTTIDVIQNVLCQNEISSGGFVYIPTRIRKVTLHSDPHSHSKTRDQYEQRRYKTLIDLYSDYDKVKELLEIKLLSNITVKIKLLQ